MSTYDSYVDVCFILRMMTPYVDRWVFIEYVNIWVFVESFIETRDYFRKTYQGLDDKLLPCQLSYFTFFQRNFNILRFCLISFVHIIYCKNKTIIAKYCFYNSTYGSMSAYG